MMDQHLLDKILTSYATSCNERLGLEDATQHDFPDLDGPSFRIVCFQVQKQAVIVRG